MEFHDASFEAAEGVSDVEGEAEALHDEELGGDYVFFCCVAGDSGCELSQGHVVVVCFCGEEERAGHDGFGVVGHWGVGEVEATKVLDCRCLSHCLSVSISLESCFILQSFQDGAYPHD